MPDEPLNEISAGWTRAAERDRVQPSHPIAVKLQGRQIALFVHEDEVFACNNRCPHEGYPLVEGVLDCNSREPASEGNNGRARCVLTCNWHNWKFDLRTGATLYGGDHLRTYPVSVRDGAIWVDLTDALAAERVDHALEHLDKAIAEFDSARIARELARLSKAGARVETAVARAIVATHHRLRDGMTHAYAATDAWLRLRDALADDAERLACAAEAIAYIAFDTLREPETPYSSNKLPWNAHAFAAAIESQDEDSAVALISGALDAEMHFDDLESALASAALAHYNDFGHSLIYAMHAGRLITRLGRGVERPLLMAWIRSLIYATREDLLPDFRSYADALKQWRDAPATLHAEPAANGPTAAALADQFEGQSMRSLLEFLSSRSSQPPLLLHAALMEAASRHLLRFDESHATRTDSSVAGNVGWLDFSHALTFGHAVRDICTRHPHVWPAGLLQLALFVARNKSYLDPQLSSVDAVGEWAVPDEDAFHRRAMSQIVDHGIGLPIFPAHWLKTWMAVRDEVAAGVPESTRVTMLAAINRLLAVRFKQRHALRNATQALRFVEKED